MVKARSCPSSSSSSQECRPSSCPPIASLSLASTHLKPSKPLKRPPNTGTLLVSMDPSPSAPPSSPVYSRKGQITQVSEDVESNAEVIPRGDKSSAEDGGAEKEKQGGLISCGRQRLQQHRLQMSGKVIIPDTWGREQQLQEWVSYGIVEDALWPHVRPNCIG